jgi:hypothetical protein
VNTRTRWDDYAACRGRDKLMLSDNAADQCEAKKLCLGCPVAEQCLTAAQAEEGAAAAKERAGVRGGLTPQQRYSAYRRDVRAAASAAAREGMTDLPRNASGQLTAEAVATIHDRIRDGATNADLRREFGLNPDTVNRHRAKVGVPARNAKPCGTYAAYKRHLRRGETPCDLCKAANALYTATGGMTTALPDVELTA